ncbi:hypothetical protein PAXINDRAFT_172589 [Paxillus involutus ATCC 200175]|uniref:Uncharacterized protein n=1 Tax=Paxillus involutus ATCC 200175 TaxID=664439 RepID=A0A0C9TPV3_PAXIN|nr:hypothetical protein PAXINDRAFT_172589 [Paxillus involutus ATCC 200175]
MSFFAFSSGRKLIVESRGSISAIAALSIPEGWSSDKVFKRAHVADPVSVPSGLWTGERGLSSFVRFDLHADLRCPFCNLTH